MIGEGATLCNLSADFLLLTPRSKIMACGFALSISAVLLALALFATAQ